jgi:hypothetical protein
VCPWDIPELGAQRCIVHARAGATLTVQLTRDERGTEIAVLGDLGTAEVELLRDCLATIAGQDVQRVVVDLRRARTTRGAWAALARPEFDRVVLRGGARRSRVRRAARRSLGQRSAAAT